jgi:hypothetical protein
MTAACNDRVPDTHLASTFVKTAWYVRIGADLRYTLVQPYWVEGELPCVCVG